MKVTERMIEISKSPELVDLALAADKLISNQQKCIAWCKTRRKVKHERADQLIEKLQNQVSMFRKGFSNLSKQLNEANKKVKILTSELIYQKDLVDDYDSMMFFLADALHEARDILEAQTGLMMYDPAEPNHKWVMDNSDVIDKINAAIDTVAI
jgi:hypothetical protein